MEQTRLEWRLEQRHNFEPGATLPDYKWRVTAKAHRGALPRAIAIVDNETNGRLIAMAQKMYSELQSIKSWLEHNIEKVGTDNCEEADILQGIIPILAGVEGKSNGEHKPTT